MRRRRSASTLYSDWAYDLLERLGIPTRLLPEVVPPTDTDRTNPRGRAGDRRRHARHRLCRRRRAIPRGRFGLPQRRDVVAGRSRGRRTADHRRDLRGQLDERGRRRRDLPPAPKRHRALAAARVPTELGVGGPFSLVRGDHRARRRSSLLADRPGRRDTRRPGHSRRVSPSLSAERPAGPRPGASPAASSRASP